MKHSTTNSTVKPGSALAQITKILMIMTLLVAVGVAVFLNFYTHYNDNILYAERLGQMKDVTAQLFSGLEDVVGNQWNTAEVLCNYAEVAQPADAETLQRFMQKQAALNELDNEQDSIIAVDSHGRYYTPGGMAGTLQELNYLLSDPARISFVSNTVTTNRTKMVFLERLEEPVPMTVGEQACELIYYGFIRDMTELEPYFDCAAYEGSSGVYVLDGDGLKLFSSQGSNSADGALIKGYNVYNVLETMQYKHGSTFDAAKEELFETGAAYSNAVLNGEEYYYALYKMDNAEWTLAFLVKSDAVARNTVELVNTTIQIVMIFAVGMAAACAFVIFWVLRGQQKKELAAADRSNAKLAELNTRLEKAVDTTETALQTAESANHAKSEFLSSMSHDIRTPMNAIVGITTLMENEINEPEKLRVHIEKLRGSGEHLLGLINDILDMNKIESGKTVLNVEKLNLADQLTQINDIIRPQMKEHRHSYIVRTENIVHENLYGDPTRLRQVLINILSNAVKYTHDHGTIEFTICERPRNGQYARYAFNITDNGIGMSEEYLQHIYDSFSRAESTMTNRVQGSGLGMAITKSIVDAMGGSIRVESAMGKGTHFEVVLDFKIDVEADENISAMNILVITAANRTLARIMDATSVVPVHVKAVTTYEEGIAYLRQCGGDAVLTPYNKAEGDASEQIAQLRAAAKGPVIVLGMSDLPAEEAIDKVKAAGLDGYISTPFFLSHLVREVERVREMQAETTPAELDTGSILKGMRFLCAEDNALNAEILEALLEMTGASCTICSDGAEIVQAFESVKPGDYDAILMDVQMPNMNGLEATRAIRAGANELGRTIPIIAMTANAFSEDVQRCLDAGMDAHLAKPINMETLEKTLKKFRISGG